MKKCYATSLHTNCLLCRVIFRIYRAELRQRETRLTTFTPDRSLSIAVFMSSNFKPLLFRTSKYEVNFTRREYSVSSLSLCAKSLDVLMGFLILILRLRLNIERHTNDQPIFRIWISKVGQNNIVTGVRGRRRAYRVANGPTGSRVRANVVMRSCEPGARKLVFFKLLPFRKPE